MNLRLYKMLLPFTLIGGAIASAVDFQIGSALVWGAAGFFLLACFHSEVREVVALARKIPDQQTKTL